MCVQTCPNPSVGKHMATVGTVVYANPPTFMEMLTECTRYIEHARQEPTTSKNDVLDSMENRLSLLVGKLASHPTCTAFILNMGGTGDDQDPDGSHDRPNNSKL